MNLLIAIFISATLGYFSTTTEVQTTYTPDPNVTIVDSRITNFKNKIYNYNHDKVLSFLVQTDSCSKESDPEKAIYLLINKNALELDEKYETVAEINHFHQVQEKIQIKKKNKSYANIPLCNSNKEMLKELNNTWEKEFRTAYEINPVFKNYEYKKEVTVAVIDTGINFKDAIINEAIPVKYKNNINSLNFSGTTNYDDSSHGSHVTGIILGVMPNAKILPLKYFNPDKSGDFNLDTSIKALKFAISQNVDIINYSGGGPEFSKREFDLFKLAQKKGILVVAAAGNERSNLDEEHNRYYPANYELDNIVSIGNSEYNNLGEPQLNPSSNYGRESVDFIMRGSKVKSFVAREKGCGVGRSTGTSMAAPAFTGVVASLMAQYPKASIKQVLAHLSKLSQPLDTNSKFGYLDLSGALNAPFDPNPREVASNNNLAVK